MVSEQLFSALLFFAVLAVGELISKKTKGLIIGALTTCIIYVVGYFTGLIPRGSVETIGFGTILSSFGMFAILTNLGTMIELRKFIREWKTVVIAVGALVIVGVGFLTIGSLLFGKTYALVAFPPVAGGSVSTAMIADAARAADQPTMAAFAWVVGILQFFVGLPLTSIIINRFCRKRVAAGIVTATETAEDGKTARRKLIPAIPDKWNSPYLVVAKLLVITVLACWLGSLTKIPSAILCLVFGVLFCELGFLDPSSLQKSGYMNFIMLCLLASAPASFSSLTLDDFLKLVGPSVFFLLFGGVMLAVGGGIFGKLLRIEPTLGAALGLAAMYGFPFSMLIPEQVIEAMGLPEEEAKALSNEIVPKMVIAGFASVTIGSVFVGAICVSLAF